jgi:hypothetical protein
VKKVDYFQGERDGFKSLSFDRANLFVIDSTIRNLDFEINESNAKKENILLINNNPWIDFEKIKKLLNPSLVVFDGSNDASKIRIWKTLCKKYELRFHDTGIDGAIIL